MTPPASCIHTGISGTAWTTASQTVLPLLASLSPLLCLLCCGLTLALSSSKPLACRTARAAVEGLLSRHQGYSQHRGRGRHVYERQVIISLTVLKARDGGAAYGKCQKGAYVCNLCVATVMALCE